MLTLDNHTWIESCPAPQGSPVRVGRPACGCSHRRLLGATSGEVVERLEVVRTGRPTVNAGIIWRYYTEKVYANADLPLIAVRECLQNASDAFDLAVRARKLRRAEATFRVGWDSDSSTLSIEDNGIGMDLDTFFGKFLVLGESGKRGADVTSQEGGRGGFGVAKAVILGTSSTFRWRIYTRDHVFTSTSFDADVEAFEAPYRAGTLIELSDVARKYHEVYNRRIERWQTIDQRVQDMLSLSDLDINLIVNGRPVPRFFPRAKGSKVRLELDWGPETTAEVKLYRRHDKAGRFYIRVNGLYQFDRGSTRGNLEGDVVIDLDTTVRPDDPRGLPYPLTAARDGFTQAAQEAANELFAYLEIDNKSGAMETEYEDLQAADPTEEELASREEVLRATAQAFEDPDVLGSLKAGIRGVEDYYAERLAEEGRATRDTSEPSPRPVGLAPAAVGPASPVPLEGQGVAALVDQVRNVLAAADHQRTRQGSNPGTILNDLVKEALDEAVVVGDLDERRAAVVAMALDKASTAATTLYGGGLLQQAGVEQAFTALAALSPVRAARPGLRNPFGQAGAVLISKKRYKRARARRFIQNYKRWLPYLIAWDATLRMVASELKLPMPFTSGFVLDDQVVGQARALNGRVTVYVNPDHFEVVRKSSQGHPFILAMFLFNLAVHELTHVQGRMGQGHDEEFVSAREENGRLTAALVPAIAAVSQRVLGLPETEDQRGVRKLRDRLNRVREDLATARGELRRSRKLPAATPAQKRERAADLVDVMEGQLTAMPPEGLDVAYVAGFFARNRSSLVDMVRELLAEADLRRTQGAVVENSLAVPPGRRGQVGETITAEGEVIYLGRSPAPRVRVRAPGSVHDNQVLDLHLPRAAERHQPGDQVTISFWPNDGSASLVDNGAVAEGSQVLAGAVLKEARQQGGARYYVVTDEGVWRGHTLAEREQDRYLDEEPPRAGTRLTIRFHPMNDYAEPVNV